MKKIFVILLILMLLLTSCKSKPTDEIAMPDTEQPTSQTEDTVPTKPSEEDKAPTKPPVTAEPETDRIEGQWQEDYNGLDGDTNHEIKEDEEEIIIDGYVINNDGFIPKEMINRDYRYEHGPESHSPSTLEGLIKYSDMIVVATPKTTYDEGEQIWKTGDGATTTDFNEANLVTSFTKRTFTVKEVIKGEPTDEIDVFERAIAQGVKMRIVEGEYITDKDDEYLLFLYKAGASDAYLIWRRTGKYRTEENLSYGEKNPDSLLYNQVRERYKEYFKE